MIVANVFSRPMLARWRDFVVYTIAGTVVFEIAFPIGWRIATRVSPPTIFQPWFVFVAAVVGVFVIAFVVAEPVRIRRQHWRHIWRYPPLWLSVAASFALSVLIAELPARVQPSQGVPNWAEWWLLAILGAALVLAVMLRQVPWRHPRAHRAIVNPSAGVLEWPVLKEWFALEQPSEHDFFSHAAVSERIATILLDSSTEQAVALLGPFGSGKSSILARVRHLLEDSDDPFVIVADFNGWAVPEAADAPRIALERIIDALGLFADVQQFRGLPVTYKRLVAAEPSGYLAKVLGASSDGEPMAQLRRLEPMLESLRARLVLFVEDADRAGDSVDSRHLARLLTTLREVKGISFVLSIDASHKARLDYRKLCDVIELVPSLTAEQVAALLLVAYNSWMTEEAYIDPREKKRSRLELDLSAERTLAYFRTVVGGSPAGAVALLIQSPRRLKHLIRRVDRVWSSLRGEVDLDDVIVLSVLRDMEDRAVFDFIAENIDFARQDPGKGPLAGKDVTTQWKAVLANSANAGAVQELVDILAIRQLSSSRSVTDRPTQSVGAADGAGDYFRRILQEQILPGEVRDQVVLQGIERWKQDRGGDMLASLSNATDEQASYVEVWEDFAWRLEDEDLFLLADAVITEALRVDGAAASMKKRPALLAIWRRLNRRARHPDAVEWVSKQMVKAVPVSLRFADDLLYYWAGDRDITRNVVSTEGWPVVRRVMLDKARETFTSVDALLRVLIDTEDGRDGWALVHFVRPPERRREGEQFVDIEPRDREWLAPLLLDAARVKPHLIVRNLINIVGDQNVWAGLPELDASTLLERVYTLHPEHVDTIFGEYAVPLLKLIAHNDAKDDVSRSAAIQANKQLSEMHRTATAATASGAAETLSTLPTNDTTEHQSEPGS